MLGDLLDSGEIDYAILDVLDQLVKNKKIAMSISTDYATNEFMYLPIIRALLETNILHKSKYYDVLITEHRYYTQLMEEYIKQKKQAMNKYEMIRYRMFKKVKGVKFGSSFSGVRPRRQRHEQKKLYTKGSYMWELGELYYDLPGPQEHFRESFI